MILTAITIRDYKQFAGEHEFAPDRQGITAVIGQNGAGKTTLFEAIEWCLYGPRSITAADVFPRGVGGSPLVRVTLENPHTGQRFVVERRLSRNKIMQADVWDDANPGEILATGSNPVKKYVSEKLIGLGHPAFVSTFFTRQKELSFFGSFGVTERRRKIGQMIGVETVRIAQTSIGEERSHVLSQANALGALADQETEERDYDAEIAAAAEALSVESDRVRLRVEESATAQSALKHASELAERVRLRAEQDQGFAREIASLESKQGRDETRLEGIVRELSRLAESETRRAALAPVAARADSLRAEVSRWEADQQRSTRITERKRSLLELANERTSVGNAIARLVQESASPHFPDWRRQADSDIEREVTRLLAIRDAIDVEADRTRLSRFETIVSSRAALGKATQELTRFQELLAQLEARKAELVQAGDPDIAREQQQRAIDKERQLLTQHETEQRQAHERAKQLVPLVTSLRNQTFDDHCPTCGRRIDEAEAGSVIAALSGQIDDWNGIANRRHVEAGTARTAVTRLEADLVATQTRAKELVTIRTRLENGEQAIATKSDEVERLQTALTEANGDAAASTPEEVERLRSRIDAGSRVISAAHGTLQRLAQLQDIARRETRTRSELAELGEAAYDSGKHQAARNEFNHANQAVATIEAIDRDLASRDAITNQRAECESSLAAVAAKLTARISERTELAYDAAEASHARERVNTRNEAERAAASALHAAQNIEREAQSTLNQLEREQARLKQQLDRSEAFRREADLLGEMYAEFGLFDQYVAARIAPRLAEQTSELLEIATDGKYSSVEFDENYGIHVFDGPTERFPLENFSGGERDVVALCARLALSQLIGSSAPNPPSFLVLDEVFGALDRDRRVQLLELLGRISESIDSFQQMFIISHVDDVRASPIFSRVIRITESANGTSRIEDATIAAGFEE